MKQIRSKLLRETKKEVSDRLEQSLHQAVLINLPAEKQPERSQRLWDVEVKIGKQPVVQLPKTISMGQVFDRAGGKLLILGSSGCGKTTTLLELAKELINRAENNADNPIPVLFNFLEWKDDKQSLANWLLTELKSKYGISVSSSKKMLQNQQIVLLLDGLDELELTRQEVGLQKINQLLQEDYRQGNVVVSSRLEDYKNCQTKLRLNGAAFLRSLNENQIKQYLFGARSRELWEDIKNEPTLLALARIPLLLNMMALAYEEISIRAWKNMVSFEECRRYLLNAYIRRMLIRDIQKKWYPKNKEPRPEKIRYWLIWLAKKIQQESTEGLNISDWFSGLAGIQNLILRFSLYKKGYIPWNYLRFLNYSTERLFLQKVNGRYWFIHSILREHFALMSLN